MLMSSLKVSVLTRTAQACVHPLSRAQSRSDGQIGIVAGGSEGVAALICREASESLPDGIPQIGDGEAVEGGSDRRFQVWKGTSGSFAQFGFEFGKDLLD